LPVRASSPICSTNCELRDGRGHVALEGGSAIAD
jgi:hypothetical protein